MKLLRLRYFSEVDLRICLSIFVYADAAVLSVSTATVFSEGNVFRPRERERDGVLRNEPHCLLEGDD